MANSLSFRHKSCREAKPFNTLLIQGGEQTEPLPEIRRLLNHFHHRNLFELRQTRPLSREVRNPVRIHPGIAFGIIPESRSPSTGFLRNRKSTAVGSQINCGEPISPTSGCDEFVFLAVILDAYSRRVNGWAMDRKMEDSLTLTALRMALACLAIEPGRVHHPTAGRSTRSWRFDPPIPRQGIGKSIVRCGLSANQVLGAATAAAPTHRLDEFPAGYSSASCPPAVGCQTNGLDNKGRNSLSILKVPWRVGS